MRGDELAAAPLRAESLALFKAIGDAWGCARMLLEIGRDEADPVRQQALPEQSLSMARSGGHPRTIATALGNLGKLDRREGRREAAEQHMQEALAIGRELGDTWISAWMLDELGLLASDHGDMRYASALFAESLALFKQDKAAGAQLQAWDVYHGGNLLAHRSYSYAVLYRAIPVAAHRLKTEYSRE